MKYTEEELKKYFNYLKKRFPNSVFKEEIEVMENIMFEPLFESHSLKYFVKELRKGEKN